MYFPLFLMKSGRKRSAHSRRQFIQCFLTGAAFRQRPLSPLTYQFSCRDKKIAPGEYIQLHEMRHLRKKAAKPIPILEKS